MKAPLDPRQKAAFEKDGFCFPVEAITEREAADVLGEVRRYRKVVEQAGGFLKQRWSYPKVHLVAEWADRLVHDERILDLAESVLGPDLLVWSTNIFTREAGSDAELAWHQDAPYFGWEDFEGRTMRVWIALTHTSRANGTMRFARGTHNLGMLPHGYRGKGIKALMRGEEVRLDIREQDAVDVELRPGQCSIHTAMTVHCSGASTSDEQRVCFAIDYIRPDVRPVLGPDSAMLVRGRDPHGHYELEPRLKREFDTDALHGMRRAAAMRDSRLVAVMKAVRSRDACGVGGDQRDP